MNINTIIDSARNANEAALFSFFSNKNLADFLLHSPLKFVLLPLALMYKFHLVYKRGKVLLSKPDADGEDAMSFASAFFGAILMLFGVVGILTVGLLSMAFAGALLLASAALQTFESVIEFFMRWHELSKLPKGSPQYLEKLAELKQAGKEMLIGMLATVTLGLILFSPAGPAVILAMSALCAVCFVVLAVCAVVNSFRSGDNELEVAQEAVDSMSQNQESIKQDKKFELHSEVDIEKAIIAGVKHKDFNDKTVIQEAKSQLQGHLHLSDEEPKDSLTQATPSVSDSEPTPKPVKNLAHNLSEDDSEGEGKGDKAQDGDSFSDSEHPHF